MKNSSYLSIFAMIGMVGLSSCSPKSQSLQTSPVVPEKQVEVPQYEDIPEQTFTWIHEDGGQSQLDFNPQIDLLFVIDNSDSMRSAQENLRRNLDKFTAGFTRNPMIDYHIGVISTWDSSERARTNKKDSYEIGELRHVRDTRGNISSRRFLDRKTATPEILASSLHIGVTPYEQGGPENEEFLSPLLAALEKTGPGTTNEGFFRENAQLVIILMTDADDASNSVSVEQAVQKLIDFKKGNINKISVYGVLVRAEDPDSAKDWNLRIHPKYKPWCFDKDSRGRPVNNGRCQPFGPERLEEFVLKSNSYSEKNQTRLREKFLMGITSPTFGSDLARIGNQITIKTLEKTIYLSQRPRIDSKTQQLMLRVRYGSPEALARGEGQVIPAGEKGWKYNPRDNSLHLSGQIQYRYQEGAHFRVELVPVTLAL